MLFCQVWLIIVDQRAKLLKLLALLKGHDVTVSDCWIIQVFRIIWVETLITFPDYALLTGVVWFSIRLILNNVVIVDSLDLVRTKNEVISSWAFRNTSVAQYFDIISIDAHTLPLLMHNAGSMNVRRWYILCALMSLVWIDISSHQAVLFNYGRIQVLILLNELVLV